MGDQLQFNYILKYMFLNLSEIYIICNISMLRIPLTLMNFSFNGLLTELCICIALMAIIIKIKE